MREAFRAYYSPSKAEFDRLWDHAVVVFDANALLNFFRYSAPTRDEWLELLKKEQDRLWIPHQVALEFHRNRRLIAHQQEKAFAEVDKALGDAEASIRASIDGLRRHPTLEAEHLSKLIEAHMKKIRKRFKKARSDHFEAVVSQAAHDQTLEAISTLYEGKVGEPYTREELIALHKEGDERYAKKIPPGYMDAGGKGGDEKYGDFVLWRQILDHGARVKKPLIFITDDSKEDWWLKSSGRTLGPRPELVEEYYASADERAHFYQPKAFLTFANQRGEKISAETIREARSISSMKKYHFGIPSEGLKSALDALSRQRGLDEDTLGILASKKFLENYRGLFAASNAQADFYARLGDSQFDLGRLIGPGGVYRAFEEQEARRQAILRRAIQGLEGDETDSEDSPTETDSSGGDSLVEPQPREPEEDGNP